jgi:16S rRNA (adenine1518-N6/adenine1519-N6)-dimethyltransferase
MKVKKSYGQHFLNKEHIARDIALWLKGTNDYQQIVEIGPGQGMLTKHLIEQYPKHQLHVIEADRDMVDYLTQHYPALFPYIIAEDFLKVRLQEHFQEPYAIIGNFPYNISSQILFKLIEYRQDVPELVGMFQKEVAERVAAQPNSKAYGVLTVLVQAYYDTEYLFTVGPEHFNPPPKVQSGVIRLTRKPNFENLGCDESSFKAIVKIAFSTRRKMLRNSMKQFFPKEVLFEDTFFQQRPENLSVSEFIALTQRASQYL